MLYMFDTQHVLNDLVAGGVPLPQAETITKVWLGVLQDFQIAMHPEQAALRVEKDMYHLRREVRSLEAVIGRLNRKERTT